MIPRQLLQSSNMLFFGILIMVASSQSSGILLSWQTFTMRGRRISAAIAGSVLKSSALRLSGPGALLSFRALTALIISSLKGGGVSISRSSTAAGISGSVLATPLFQMTTRNGQGFRQPDRHNTRCRTRPDGQPRLRIGSLP